ncbi:Kelch repeat-containing protein [Haladaptatus sp. CMSO5]|uniref:Kelch repeat-containing protein n=1 Tax=Haladaptatus sp. CMSO5 TaxID=3120514 RepID=UPI002FCE1E27
MTIPPSFSHPTRRSFLTTTGLLFGTLSVAGCSSLIAPPSLDTETSWERGASLSLDRTEVAATTLGTSLYVIGGIEPGRQASRAVERFDPERGSWERAPSLPVGLHHTAAVSVGNAIYVIGGYQNQWDPVNTVYRFDGTAWTERATMPTVRGALSAAAHDGIIYVAGGAGIDGVLATFERYDTASDSWARGPPMPTAREHLASAVVGGKFYAIGGRTGGLRTNRRTTEVYDPETNEWRAVAGMPTARSGFGATVFDDTIVVAGGEGAGGTIEEVELYMPETDEWLRLPDMPTPRHGLGVTALGNRIFTTAGGPEPGFFYANSVEVLTFEAGSVRPVVKTSQSLACDLPLLGGLLRGTLC